MANEWIETIFGWEEKVDQATDGTKILKARKIKGLDDTLKTAVIEVTISPDSTAMMKYWTSNDNNLENQSKVYLEHKDSLSPRDQAMDDRSKLIIFYDENFFQERYKL